MTSHLLHKAAGAIWGGAVGDAMGGVTEGASRDDIQNAYGGWVQGIVEEGQRPWRRSREIPPLRRGAGRVTDDTLMTLALVRVYERKRRHLDAYDVVELLVPEIADKASWIPELEVSAPIATRLFYAEKWLLIRLRHGNADPREAGVGNMVNCGAAMYMAPVGVVNAGNPRAAYAEAIDVSGAHQSSYGREGAGVMAAAVAAAMTNNSSAAYVADAVLDIAHDGTRAAILATLEAGSSCTDREAVCDEIRRAVAPFDPVGDGFGSPGLGAYRPSRVWSIEELPVALGLLIAADGDYKTATLEAVNYGRDADSIAAMAGALAGAINGIDAIPEEWRTAVRSGSRMDLDRVADSLVKVADEIFEVDEIERRNHVHARALLKGSIG